MRAEQQNDQGLEAWLALVIARYGDRIPAVERERVRESVRGLRAAADALAAFPLTNADEPDVLFRVYRGED
jgi:hypothetical protein